MTVNDVLAALLAGVERDEQLARTALGEDHVHESFGELLCPGARCAHDVQHPPARALRLAEKLREAARLAELLMEDAGSTDFVYGAAYEIVRALAGIYTEPTEETEKP